MEKLLAVIFFGIISLNLINYLQLQYLSDYKKNETSGSYLNQKAVIDWIYKDAENGKFGYFVYSPSVYTHTVDYLVSWNASKYPGVKLENQKNKNFYLILYPRNKEDEGAYEFWKKNTIKTNGKVISRKVFRGDIIVEKIAKNEAEEGVDPNYYQGLIFR